MTEPIRIGLVGCGRIAPRHVAAIKEVPGAELAASCDIIPERCIPGTLEYANYQDMLGNVALDLIHICTPSHLHFEMAVEALNAHKHVLVEKPMSMTRQQGVIISQHAEDFGLKLATVLQNRFNPPMIVLKKAIDQGHLGRIYVANAAVRWYRPQSYYEGWHGRSGAGDVLMNQAIHHIDGLLWLLDQPVVDVQAMIDTLGHYADADDAAVVLLRFKNAALASIEASTLAYPKNLEGSITVIGEKGTVKVGGTHLNELTTWRVEGQPQPQILTDDDGHNIYGTSHRAVIANMVQAIRNDEEPATNGREGLRALQVLDAIKAVEVGL